MIDLEDTLKYTSVSDLALSKERSTVFFKGKIKDYMNHRRTITGNLYTPASEHGIRFILQKVNSVTDASIKFRISNYISELNENGEYMYGQGMMVPEENTIIVTDLVNSLKKSYLKNKSKSVKKISPEFA